MQLLPLNSVNDQNGNSLLNPQISHLSPKELNKRRANLSSVRQTDQASSVTSKSDPMLEAIVPTIPLQTSKNYVPADVISEISQQSEDKADTEPRLKQLQDVIDTQSRQDESAEEKKVVYETSPTHLV